VCAAATLAEKFVQMGKNSTDKTDKTPKIDHFLGFVGFVTSVFDHIAKNHDKYRLVKK